MVCTGDNQTSICGASKIVCYNNAEDKLLKKAFVDGVGDDTNIGNMGCNCLPSCTSITYDAEISQANFDWVSLFTAYNNSPDEFQG